MQFPRARYKPVQASEALQFPTDSSCPVRQTDEEVVSNRSLGYRCISPLIIRFSRFEEFFPTPHPLPPPPKFPCCQAGMRLIFTLFRHLLIGRCRFLLTPHISRHRNKFFLLNLVRLSYRVNLSLPYTRYVLPLIL